MSCRLKHLAVAAAIIGLATQVHAGYFPGSTDFDNAWTNTYWSLGEAEIIPGVPGIRATYLPSSFSGSSPANVLSVDNDTDAPVVCNLGGTSTSSIYADVLVKGTPLANDASVPDVGPTDKILVYTRINSSTTPPTTNLCVLARPSAGALTNEDVIASTNIGKDEWHRIIIEAVNDGSYKVYCDTFDQANPLGTYYPINTGSSMSSVAFAGTGAVDDLILSDLIPEQLVYTVTWDTSLASVKYTTDGITTNDLTVADGQYQFQSASPITIIANNGFRTFDDTYTPSSAAPTHALVVPTGLAYYSDGDGTAGNPYEIPTYEALVAMKDAVAGGTDNYRSAYYVQTRDIDCTGKAAFAGIGTYSSSDEGDLKAGDPRGGVPFTGTYDGDGYKISNIAFTSRSYAGIFNQVNGGTIKNLTVENATGAKGISIVGNAGNGATLQNLVAEGTFGSSSAPATHNAAGIVIRLSAGGTGTLVKDCTNNATIYGTYTKVGGICALTQTKVSGGAVTFDGCANNGDLYLNHTPSSASDLITGFAGIVGYVQDDTVLVGCSNTGTLYNTNEAANKDKDGALIGWAYGKALTDNGGNSAAKTDKMVGYQTAGTAGQSITGFKYATISGDVATTVTTPAVGNTYLLEGNVAASGTPVATLASGETIAFDAALGYSFAGTVSATSPLVAIPSTSGTVTTYSTGYFPRTATAGQDGTAEHPFEIADLDDLEALQAAVAADIGRNLCYTQTADIALTEAWDGIGYKDGKDDAAKDIFKQKAFTGVYDGGNHTISGLQLVNGCDFGGLFNSVYQATIKNLKMTWGASTLTPNSSSSGDDTGATFVGVARESTLFNLTALAGTVTTVSASKDVGGIVGYLMAGSTVDSCTNELNLASLKNTGRKCGGIAIITQGGSGTAVIRNCKNSGTITAQRKGGILGYVGVATEIDSCENTAAVEFLWHESGAVTISGTNTGNATVRSSNKGGYDGLNFAIVDNDVATFVADNALALDGEYKVMATNVTATFAFAAPGTIAFDQSMYTPTYAITAGEGLALGEPTLVNNVKTYTATVSAPAYPTYLADADADVKANYDAWKVENGADANSEYENQFLVNAAPATVVPNNALAITEIAQNETAGWDITIECTVSGVDLSGTVGTAKAGNGYLAISYAADLTGPWTTENIAITASANGKVTVNVNKAGAKFMKAKLSSTAEPQN